jgi:hypothetical protein
MASRSLDAALWIFAALLLGCEHPRGGASAVTSATQPVPQVASAAPAPSTSEAPPAASAPAPVASAPAPPPAPLPPADPLLGADGKALPQTEDRPRPDSPALVQKIELLTQAILKDDPALALPAFFPVVAYEQVKDIANPARDWKLRLVAAFERNIHEYHRAIGAKVQSLRVVGLEIPEPGVRWMKPGSEGNRVGYFRVLRSKLRLETDQGKSLAFEITSFISWRGEWYIVHLKGFE